MNLLPDSTSPSASTSGSPSTSWRERLTSALTWHIVACAALAIFVLVLGIRLGMDWAATNDRSSSALEQKQIQLRALERQTAPLAGLDHRVDDSRKQIATFYSRRIPANYSSIPAPLAILVSNPASAFPASNTPRVNPAQTLPRSSWMPE
jgi:hypothetical protein